MTWSKFPEEVPVPGVALVVRYEAHTQVAFFIDGCWFRPEEPRYGSFELISLDVDSDPVYWLELPPLPAEAEKSGDKEKRRLRNRHDDE